MYVPNLANQDASAVEALIIFELLELLASINLDSPEAKLNEISMSDNNGGRIYF